MHVTRACVEGGEEEAAEDGSRCVRVVARPPVFLGSEKDDPMQIAQDDGMCYMRFHSCAS